MSILTDPNMKDVIISFCNVSSKLIGNLNNNLQTLEKK
jgi:hypothetical protein